jgi:hypothetical protein
MMALAAGIERAVTGCGDASYSTSVCSIDFEGERYSGK